MKLLSVLLSIFIVVIGVGFWTNHLLVVTSDELVAGVNQVAEGIDSNHWDRADAGMTELEKTWERQAGWWPVVLDHQEIDNIEFSLARVSQYVAAKNKALAGGQLSELKLMIRHIPEIEAVKLRNIF
jgi:hypothetical protein